MTDVLGIDEIIIGIRDRTDLGDLAGLAASITKDGLLHPVVVNDAGELVAGGRRLEAMRLLGWAEVPVRQMTFDAAEAILSAEMAENTCRKDLTPVEAERARYRRARMMAPEAEQRLQAGIRPSGNVPQGRTRDRAAIGTGYSGRTLDKVAEVRETAEDETVPEPVREIAREQLAAMDKGTTNPTQAQRAVRDARTPAAKPLPPTGERSLASRKETARIHLKALRTAFRDLAVFDGFLDYDLVDVRHLRELGELLDEAMPRLRQVLDRCVAEVVADTTLTAASEDDFEQAIAAATVEGDLSRVNIAAKLPGRIAGAA